MWYDHSKLTGIAKVSKTESKELVGAIFMRKKLPLFGWPIAAGIVVSSVWVILFIRGNTMLMHKNWDLWSFLFTRSTNTKNSIFIIMGIITATLFYIVSWRLLRRLLNRQIDHHLFTPACFWCGYLLIGLEPKNGGIRCPECSKTSPVATKPEPSSPPPQ